MTDTIDNKEQKEIKIDKTLDVFYTEASTMELYDFLFACMNKPKILENINARNCTIKNTGSTYRVINHWESLGLIDNDRAKNDIGWRKFSAVDLAWISILKALRDFGFSSDKIKVVKKCLTEKISVEPKVNWLEYILCRARAKRNSGNIYLIVFNTGRAIVTTNDDINFNKALSSLPEAYITINLDKLFSKMIKNSNITEKSEHSYELSDGEITVLSNIRTSEADKINIKLKDGKISLIEKVFAGTKDDSKALHEIIESIGYGEANLKIENGKVIYIQRIEKKKMRDNQ